MTVPDPFEVPCIGYKPSCKVEDLKEVELKIIYEDGTRKKAKCPRFSGKGGDEELLFIAEYFENIALDENIEDKGKFEYFRKILDHGPRTKWMSLNPASYQQDEVGFKDFFRSTMPSIHPHWIPAETS